MLSHHSTLRAAMEFRKEISVSLLVPIFKMTMSV